MFLQAEDEDRRRHQPVRRRRPPHGSSGRQGRAPAREGEQGRARAGSGSLERDIQVLVADENLYETLKQQISPELQCRLALSCSDSSKVWLVGDGLTAAEQERA